MLLTADAGTRDEAIVDVTARAKAAGIIGVVPKPFDIDQLIAAVHNAVGDHVQPSSDEKELAHQAALFGRLQAAGASGLLADRSGMGELHRRKAADHVRGLSLARGRRVLRRPLSRGSAS